MHYWEEKKNEENSHIRCLLIFRHFTYIIDLNPPSISMRWELFTYTNNLKPSKLITLYKVLNNICITNSLGNLWLYFSVLSHARFGHYAKGKFRKSIWSSYTKDNKWIIYLLIIPHKFYFWSYLIEIETHRIIDDIKI